MVYSGAWREKTRRRKSRDTIPLRVKGWQVYVETLSDYGIHTVSHPHQQIGSYNPPTPPFKDPSADYSQSHSYIFCNLLKRLAFSLATFYFYGVSPHVGTTKVSCGKFSLSKILATCEILLLQITFDDF